MAAKNASRDNFALLVATMLEVRSANLMDLAAALPREADRTDMRSRGSRASWATT